MKKISKFSIILFLLIISEVLSISPSYAGLGKIAGTVIDEQTGAPLPGAQVTIAATTMGATTNERGQYVILNVPPGIYTVKASFIGYATGEIRNVQSRIDATTKIDIQLKSAIIEGETIIILAEHPAIDRSMTTTTFSLSGDLIENTLPVNNLNEILQTSISIQSMRGANKAGVAYLFDGVNITDIMTPTGGGADPYTIAKRNINPIGSSTGEFSDLSNIDVRGRSSDMVQTSVGVNQNSVAEVNMVAGTFNAEYNASAGIVNIVTKSGGKNYSGKFNFRTSAGGLNHAGPNCYTTKSSNPNILRGKSAAELYNEYRDLMDFWGNEERTSKLNWTLDSYEYGEAPRITSEFSFGGPMTDKGNFFFSGNFLNDHGRFPGEFQRNLGLGIKINYDVSESDRLAVYGKIDDWGQLFGWTNRSYSYQYQFFLEGQPVWDRCGFITYLKHTHVFNPASFLESTVTYISNEKTWGYKPVDDQLKYNDYGDDWLILDTKEKANFYLNNYETRIFTGSPGGDVPYYIEGFYNQARYGYAYYYYENLNTNTLTLASNYTNQINFHHQLKSGLEYKLNTIDELEHKFTSSFPDMYFKFATVDYSIHPWSIGTFIQDKIEYEGIVVNLGLRFDAYDLDTKFWNDYFEPVEWDTTSAGQVLMVWNKGKNSKIHKFFSPRIGISHPISENAAMHYSWGIYTTQPNFGYWLLNYNSFENPSLPMARNPDPEPEKATAYEIGINQALTNDFGVDITAYYRDVRNGSAISYCISQDRAATGTSFSIYSYYTNWGYRDSRGLELNFWKRPNSERYFGIVGLSGNLSLSYSYDKTSIDGMNLSQDENFTTTLAYDDATANYDWDVVNFWPTYSRGYNDVKAKMALLWDFPFEFKLATLATYRSPWRYEKQLNITNARYEELLEGESFFRLDLRLTKYFTIKKYHGGVFLEILNVLDRENILAFDNFSNTNFYEAGLGPYGMFNRPTDQYGNPLAGIAREIYLGFEFSL